MIREILAATACEPWLSTRHPQRCREATHGADIGIMPYCLRVSAAMGIVALTAILSNPINVSDAFTAVPGVAPHTSTSNNDDHKLLTLGHRRARLSHFHENNAAQSRRCRQPLAKNDKSYGSSLSVRVRPSFSLPSTSPSVDNDSTCLVQRRTGGYRRPHSRYTGCKPRSITRFGMSSQETEGIANPLSRDDAERAGISKLITYFAETPAEQWNPDVLEAHLPTLMKGVLYKQTMAERMAKVKSDEEQNGLMQVDAFLSGYLKQERRNLSRKKVSALLSAATQGGAVLDELMKKMSASGQLDADLKEFLTTAVETEVNKGKTVQTSELLRVLKAMKTRVEAEDIIREAPDIRVLAQVMQIEHPEERLEFLRGAFTRLEDLDNFVNRLDACMEYIGTEFNFSVRTNMPLMKLDLLKDIHKEATELRGMYLQ